MKIIKINIKGYIKTKKNNETIIINTKGIKKDNEISYIHDNINHKIIIKDDIITLTRENNEFLSKLEFTKDIDTKSTFLLKEKNAKVIFNIKTIKIENNSNSITIVYKVLETDELYEYKIETR